MVRHPCIDEGVAKVIGQRIGQHSRQTVKSCLRQVREDERSTPIFHRHSERSQLNSGALPRRGISKSVIAELGIQRHRANLLSPYANFNDWDVFHGYTFFIAAPFSWLHLARSARTPDTLRRFRAPQ